MNADSVIAASPTRSPVDLPTLLSIAALVSVLSVMLHEALGHGGSCLLLGGHAKAWGAFYFDCDYAGLSVMDRRLVAAAGNTVNLLTALVAFLALMASVRTSNAVRVFWWLLLAENLMIWAGYFLFSGVSGLGDWGGSIDGVLQGLNVNLWRIVLTLGGAALYVLAVFLAARHLVDVLGGEAAGRVRRTRTLTLPAYLIGGVVAVLIGLLNPEGIFIVLASAAAATLGGTSGLVWLPVVMPRSAVSRRPALTLERNWVWIGFSVTAVILYAVVLGPTLTF